MSIKKLLLALPLISLLAFNVQAAEPTKSMNTKNTTTQKANTTNTKKTEANKKNSTANTKKLANDKSQANTSKKATPKTPQVQGLDSFNKNVTINLMQRINAVQDNQPVAIFVYEVANKGRSKIKGLHWASAFTVNEQIFFLQENITPVFEQALEPKQKETVTLTLLLDKIPESVRPLFASLETPIGHITVAKQIDFTNGKKIIVKEE